MDVYYVLAQNTMLCGCRGGESGLCYVIVLYGIENLAVEFIRAYSFRVIPDVAIHGRSTDLKSRHFQKFKTHIFRVNNNDNDHDERRVDGNTTT
jgi:hypothetical protein